MLDKTRRRLRERNGYHNMNEEGLRRVLGLYGSSDFLGLDFDLSVAHFVTRNLKNSSSSFCFSSGVCYSFCSSRQLPLDHLL